MSEQLFHFKVSKGGQLLNEVTLAQNVIKIGRMASSHLQIDDEGISRMHAVIEVEGSDQFTIIDLGSETGVLVNGNKVNKSPISNGDVITLGNIDIHVTIGSQGQVVQPAVGTYPTQAYAAAPEASVKPEYAAPVVPPQFSGKQAGMAMGTTARKAPAGRIQTRPAVPFTPNLVEDASKVGTEVITVWKDTVLQVVFYNPVQNQKKLKNFNIGEDSGCDFPIQSEFLNGLTKMPLVINHLGGMSSITIMPNAKGDVTFEDGTRVALADLISSGRMQSSSEAPGCHNFQIPLRARVKIDIGDFTFLASSVATPRKIATPIRFDWRNQKFFGVAFLIHFLVIFLAYFDPGNSLFLSLDSLEEAIGSIKYKLNPMETKEQEDDNIKKDNKKDDNEGGTGKRHKGEEGQMGRRDAAKTNNRYGIKGPADNPDPHMARDMIKSLAKEAGILKYLSASNAPTSPFGRDTALGVDPENALGALMGDQIGDNFGYGGLGLRGTGRGGGGTGEGTIGLGSLGTIGHGGGGGSGQGYGRGAGGLGGRRGRAPLIRSGAAMVKGSLSKEVIRRIVHRHINEVKFCYERELSKNPDLSGRIAIKFIISGNGAVQTSAVAESTIGNPVIENCIAQAVRRWTFPQPEGGGIVIVTYPFQLQSSGG